MKRFLLILVNCAILALIFLGIPEATRAQVAGYQISKAPTPQFLILYGLGGAAAANAFLALMFLKDRKDRKLGWEWAGIFAVLCFLQYSLIHGYVNFTWLKHAFQWLQKHL